VHPEYSIIATGALAFNSPQVYRKFHRFQFPGIDQVLTKHPHGSLVLILKVPRGSNTHLTDNESKAHIDRIFRPCRDTQSP
jgi:hypothetical protein